MSLFLGHSSEAESPVGWWQTCCAAYLKGTENTPESNAKTNQELFIVMYKNPVNEHKHFEEIIYKK